MRLGIHLTLPDYLEYYHHDPVMTRWLLREAARHSDFMMFYGVGTHSRFNGGYIWGCIVNRRSCWAVFLNDTDDGCCDKEFDTEKEAQMEFLTLCKTQYISMRNLVKNRGYSF